MVEGLPEDHNWLQSRRTHLKEGAIKTLFPDQYIAGDAIGLARKALNLKYSKDSYTSRVNACSTKLLSLSAWNQYIGIL